MPYTYTHTHLVAADVNEHGGKNARLLGVQTRHPAAGAVTRRRARR